MKEEILVGLSGGVDSAVTINLLKGQGHKVVGVFLDMLKGNNSNDFKRAKFLAKQLGVRLIKKDIKKEFQKEIINNFIAGYRNGLTPNPCVICNPKIKFKYLLDIADELGIKKVATGHYAKINRTERGVSMGLTIGSPVVEPLETVILQKAKDKLKDQSYFLYRLTQKDLKRIKLPLGNLLKTEVKNLAEELNLKVPKSESQDVCFLKKYKDLEDFLKKELSKDSSEQGRAFSGAVSAKPRLVGDKARPLENGAGNENFLFGNIVDDNGIVLGKHRGLFIYTIGQRKNLNIGGDGPFYVIGKDFKNNELIVSKNKLDKKLVTKNIFINEVNWINRSPREDKRYQIKIRYQMKSVDATFKKNSGKNWEVKCIKPIWAVAPGQSLVAYDGDKVIGGGIIAVNV